MVGWLDGCKIGFEDSLHQSKVSLLFFGLEMETTLKITSIGVEITPWNLQKTSNLIQLCRPVFNVKYRTV